MQNSHPKIVSGRKKSSVVPSLKLQSVHLNPESCRFVQFQICKSNKFFFLLGPQTASCEDCVWKVSLIRLYTKIQRVLKTQITSGVLGNVISSYRDVKRSWWAPSYVRRSWAPRSRVQLPGPDPALLLVLRRDVMSAWMAGIKGFTVCMKWTEETPYSHSGSKNGCASGPQLVHPHRRNKISLVGKLN